MKSNMTKTTVTVATAILIALTTAMTGKSQVSTAKDADFEPKSETLEHAPGNIAVVQPTHFPQAAGKIKHQHSGDTLTRTVGRNVTFRDLIAEAYDCSPGCVALPADAPKGGFDFLVTISPKTRKHLRSAIETQLGYIATSEKRETDVLILQAKDGGSPALTVNTDGDSDINYREGKLYFTHQPMSVVVKGLEDGLATPIIDRTALTNYYDFSVTWTEKTSQAMRDGRFHLEGVQKAINDWDLELTPDRASMEIFTVKKTHD